MLKDRCDAAERLAGLPPGGPFDNAVNGETDALTLAILLSIVGGGKRRATIRRRLGELRGLTRIKTKDTVWWRTGDDDDQADQ